MVITTCLSVQAQNEVNNWTFGKGGFMTWNETQTLSGFYAVSSTGATGNTLSGLPTPGSRNSAINTVEGCFTVSDAAGNLLFYSSGMTVYDKTHTIMSNGTSLNGSDNATQSGIILPYPNVPNRYVAVTIGKANLTGYNSPLNYSVVDMSLNTGLGAVVIGQKNLPFPDAPDGTFYESVMAVRVPNTSDYWIISPSRLTATHYMAAWRLSSTGLADPVKSPPYSRFRTYTCWWWRHRLSEIHSGRQAFCLGNKYFR